MVEALEEKAHSAESGKNHKENSIIYCASIHSEHVEQLGFLFNTGSIVRNTVPQYSV